VYAINIKNKLFFPKPDGMPVVNAIPCAGEILRSKTCVGCFIMSKFNKFLSKIQILFYLCRNQFLKIK
jgi:hypothetical protein